MFIKHWIIKNHAHLCQEFSLQQQLNFKDIGTSIFIIFYFV